jgi:hypothetical protein
VSAVDAIATLLVQESGRDQGVVSGPQFVNFQESVAVAVGMVAFRWADEGTQGFCGTQGAQRGKVEGLKGNSCPLTELCLVNGQEEIRGGHQLALSYVVPSGPSPRSELRLTCLGRSFTRLSNKMELISSAV